MVPCFDFDALRKAFRGTYMVNNGYDLARVEAAVRKGRADLVAFGRPFIANPDLVERLKTGAPLAEPNPATFYGGDDRGYIDYPALAQEPLLVLDREQRRTPDLVASSRQMANPEARNLQDSKTGSQ